MRSGRPTRSPRRVTGRTVTYDADLRLKGPLGGVLDTLLGLAFRRIGDRATAGLRETLSR